MMSELTIADWIALCCISLVSGVAALWLSGILSAYFRQSSETSAVCSTDSHFLLRGDELIDQDVKNIAENHPVLDASHWTDLRAWLSERFPDLPDTLNDLPQQTHRSIEVESSTLDISRQDGFTRVTLKDAAPHSAAAWHTLATQAQSEHQALSILQSAPDPIWRTNADGDVIWQNTACATLFSDDNAMPQINQDNSDTGLLSTSRFSVADNDIQRWYEVRRVAQGRDILNFATDVTEVVHAETVQREFVQTLTKTFANLTTGLAIFDKHRRLALFNPALVDLTSVPVTFLSVQPDLMNFFDELRERQILPEPKNYADWRTQIRDAVSQANDGLYQEMWTLPTGLTYRVTGRPHPDGAVAFLFEDISAEISLTRRFRTQIELRQAVLDRMEDAVAIIAPNNLLMFCNKPCNGLLNVDPDTSFADMSVRDLFAAMRDRFGESNVLTRFERDILVQGAAIPDPVTLTTGSKSTVSCQIKPLPGGSRMLVLSERSRVATPISMSAAS